MRLLRWVKHVEGSKGIEENSTARKRGHAGPAAVLPGCRLHMPGRQGISRKAERSSAAPKWALLCASSCLAAGGPLKKVAARLRLPGPSTQADCRTSGTFAASLRPQSAAECALPAALPAPSAGKKSSERASAGGSGRSWPWPPLGTSGRASSSSPPSESSCTAHPARWLRGLRGQGAGRAALAVCKEWVHRSVLVDGLRVRHRCTSSARCGGGSNGAGKHACLGWVQLTADGQTVWKARTQGEGGHWTRQCSMAPPT